MSNRSRGNAQVLISREYAEKLMGSKQKLEARLKELNGREPIGTVLNGTILFVRNLNSGLPEFGLESKNWNDLDHLMAEINSGNSGLVLDPRSVYVQPTLQH
jgi:hypothetical protein